MTQDDQRASASQTRREVLEATAWWRLHHSEQLPPHLSDDPRFQTKPRLRIWEGATGFYGLEGPRQPMTLTVCEVLMHDDATRFVMRHAIWQRIDDLTRLRQALEQTGNEPTNDPTIDICDCSIDVTALHALLREGALIHLPALWLEKPKSVTCDAETVGFEFFSADEPPAVLRLQWSHDTPESWARFLAWFDRLRATLESWLHPS